MTMAQMLSVLMFAAATTITPGPTNIMATYSGINFGFRRTLPFIAGMAVGFFALVLLCAVGVGSLVVDHPSGARALKIVGSAYLLYLAFKISRMRPPEAAQPADRRRYIGFWASVAFQFSNPKAWMMGLSASAVFVPVGDKVQAGLLIAFILAATMTVSVGLWVKAGSSISGYLRHAPTRQKQVNIVLAALTAGSILLL